MPVMYVKCLPQRVHTEICRKKRLCCGFRERPFLMDGTTPLEPGGRPALPLSPRFIARTIVDPSPPPNLLGRRRELYPGDVAAMPRREVYPGDHVANTARSMTRAARNTERKIAKAAKAGVHESALEMERILGSTKVDILTSERWPRISQLWQEVQISSRRFKLASKEAVQDPDAFRRWYAKNSAVVEEPIIVLEGKVRTLDELRAIRHQRAKQQKSTSSRRQPVAASPVSGILPGSQTTRAPPWSEYTRVGPDSWAQSAAPPQPLPPSSPRPPLDATRAHGRARTVSVPRLLPESLDSVA